MKKSIMFEETILSALKIAYKLYKTILYDGTKSANTKNQYGDTSLIMDIAIEELIIKEFRKSGIPLRVVSEEHGIVNLDLNPKYTLFMDGLDGSSVYKNNPQTGRFGTMIAIYDGLDPIYNDYISAGIIEYTTNNIYLCTKNKGTFLIRNKEKINIMCTSKNEINKKSKIYIDKAFDINNKTFSEPLSNYNIVYLKASAPYYVDFIEGKCIFVLECTRKGNLEIACAYALVKEAKGYMIDLYGNELGLKKHFNFSSNINLYTPVITTPSLDMYKNLIKLIN